MYSVIKNCLCVCENKKCWKWDVIKKYLFARAHTLAGARDLRLT